MTNERVTDAFLEAELYAIRGYHSLDHRTLPATTLRKMLKELIQRRAEERSDEPKSPEAEAPVCDHDWHCTMVADEHPPGWINSWTSRYVCWKCRMEGKELVTIVPVARETRIEEQPEWRAPEVQLAVLPASLSLRYQFDEHRWTWSNGKVGGSGTLAECITAMSDLKSEGGR